MKNVALNLENVEKYFPPTAPGWRAFVQPISRLTVPALRGISFEAKQGEVLALVGANGAGKSTLLRILTTLLIPTRGRALVCGFDVAREPARVRLQIGYHTGGDACFYSRLTARENLLLFAGLNNLAQAEAARRIAELTEPFGLGALLDRQVRTLSTGNIHRLGLARAMMHRPSVLILDEPTRSLDPLAAADFRRFLLTDVVGGSGPPLSSRRIRWPKSNGWPAGLPVLDSDGCWPSTRSPASKSANGSGSLEESLETVTCRAAREAT